jgi:hypothetical protein
MRTTYTWDPGPPKIAQATGCGYPVNMIYDDGTVRVLPMEQNADEPTCISPIKHSDSSDE